MRNATRHDKTPVDDIRLTQTVLVLNASYEPLHVVPLRKALTMLHRQVAVVEETADTTRTFGPYPAPRVLRLVRYVSMRWQHREVGWTRTRLLARDQHACGYCGAPAHTVDHILPVSRGGQNTWVNTVAACNPCNNRKGNRTPAEAGFKLRVTPAAPSVYDLYRGLMNAPIRATIAA